MTSLPVAVTLVMASPPHKLSKLAHTPPVMSASSYSPSAASHKAPMPPPPSSGSSKRLGLTSGVDKSKVKKLTLKPKCRLHVSLPEYVWGLG